MSDRISLVRWRDAKADPPGHPGDFPTDVGIAWHSDISGQWFDRNAAFGSPALEHQPKWWCDPIPPWSDTLTTEALRRILHALYKLTPDDEGLYDDAAHLRRAIKKAER